MLVLADPGGRAYTTVGTSNANLLAFWSDIRSITSSVPTNTTVTLVAGGGRYTGSCINMIQSNAIYLMKSVNNQPTVGVAFAFRTDSLEAARPIAGFADTSTLQLNIRLTAAGALEINRNGTILATTVPFMSTNTWYHIEFRATIHNTAGAYDLWVQGVSQLSATGQNTRASANNYVNIVAVGGMPNGSGTSTNLRYDDIIIYDGQATDANGLADITGPVGDCGVTVLLPNGAGTTTQFTPDSAAANYTRVNEASPDTTSYVESSTIGQKDTYALADLPATVTVAKSVLILPYARKTDVGSRQMGAVVRTGGADFTHPTGIDLGDTYLYYPRNWGRNPATGLAWTVADINALEAGQTVNS